MLYWPNGALGVKIVLLGTGSAIPSVTRLSSSSLVVASGSTLLVDIGPAVVRRIMELDYSLGDVDVLLLTHFHPDHSVDLATFLFECNFGSTPRRRPLTIIGGKGVQLFIRRFYRLYPWIRPLHYKIAVKSLPDGLWKTGDIIVKTAPTEHREESIAVRFEQKGKCVVFSGDTDYSPSLVELAKGADLLVSECTFPARKKEGHLNLMTLLKMVAEAQPKGVIMTHLDPEWEQFRGSLPLPLLLGEDGMEIDL
jgi:ribonuclease BN (tRNA processing enzyme)